MAGFICAALFVLLSGLAPPLTLASEMRSAAGLADPVIISGSRLDSFQGTANARIRVFAVHNGALVTIPFQIDQRDSRDNWVWDAVAPRNRLNRYEYDNLGMAGPDWEDRRTGRTYDDQDPEGEALLDANDMVVFAAADLGSQASGTESGFGDASAVAQIRVVDADGNTQGWAYLARYASLPPPLSPLRYMRYVPEKQQVISPVYQATFSAQHISVLEQLTMGGLPLLDRTRLRGEVRAGRSPVSLDFRFTENNIHGYVEGYIAGPVRVVRCNVAVLRTGGLVSISNLRSVQFFYPHHSEVPVNLSLGIVTEKASLLLAADYYGSPFRQAFASGNPAAIPLQDTANGHNLLKPREGLSWLALDGERASVVSVLTLSDDIRNYAEFRALLVEDSAASRPPEDHPGVEPEAGYLIEIRPGFPRGTHKLVGTYLYLARPFTQGDAEQAVRLAGGRLQVRISRLDGVGEGDPTLAGPVQQPGPVEPGSVAQTLSGQ